MEGLHLKGTNNEWKTMFKKWNTVHGHLFCISLVQMPKIMCAVSISSSACSSANNSHFTDSTVFLIISIVWINVSKPLHENTSLWARLEMNVFSIKNVCIVSYPDNWEIQLLHITIASPYFFNTLANELHYHICSSTVMWTIKWCHTTLHVLHSSVPA